MAARPSYFRVWRTFLRNSLVREMTFRGNFLITIVTRGFWFVAQLTLFEIIYRNVDAINDWTRAEYFAFMATGMLINAVVEAFFMPNCANFSELIRTGNLDFALLKPIDTQFLISFEKMDLAMLNQILMAGGLLGYALFEIGSAAIPMSLAMELLHADPHALFSSVAIAAAWLTFDVLVKALVYLVYLLAGVAFLYSMMIALASTSIWFGRNQGLYDFWFYLTIFARYPRSIYSGSPTGEVLRFSFSFVIPILLVVTVPARSLLDKPLDPSLIGVIPPVAALAGLWVSRRIFILALRSYRSASS